MINPAKMPAIGGIFELTEQSGYELLSGLSSNAPSPTEPPAHAPMPEVNRLAVHQRASTDNALDAMRCALSDGGVRHAPTTEGSMKPDARDLPFDGLTHHVDRHVGMRCDHDAIQFSGHALEIRKAPGAFDL
jgi:hypothetical protein